MKHKFLIITVFLSLFLLCSCNKEDTEIYSNGNLNINEIINDNPELLMQGFAEDLCVPDDISVLKTEPEDISENCYGVFLSDEKSIKEYKDIYRKIYPASTTKIMTCLLALENLDLNDEVIIPDGISIDISGSSMAGINPGDKMTVCDLLYALMLPSGNDAACAVAILTSGSIPDFVNMMNEKAHSLGAVRTNFVNPHGLPDENHYSTVYDMYLIFNEACKNADFCRITSDKEYTAFIQNEHYSQTDGIKEVSWRNTNGFLNGKYMLDEGVAITAGKTGHTNAAGYCLVLNSNVKNKPVISIIMHDETQDSLYKNMKNLLK